jgi:hypothetical protein
MYKNGYWFGTTRFNNETLNENLRYRENNDCKCIYGLQKQLNYNKIPVNSKVIVLEMNNAENKLVGVGVIKNYVYFNEPIYSDSNFNQYIYRGAVYIERSALKQPFLENIERKLFYGSRHMKRGTGITLISNDKLDDADIVYITNLLNTY